MVLADPVSRQILHVVRPGEAGVTRPGRATCRAAPRWCRADADRLGPNRVHRCYVPPCARYDGSTAGVVQLARRMEAGLVGQALWMAGNIERGHVVVPEGFDDPGQPTGGSIYDQRVFAVLAGAGWEVRVTALAAAQPSPDPGALADPPPLLAAIPYGAIVPIYRLIA